METRDVGPGQSAAPEESHEQPEAALARDMVLRFRAAERRVHWSLAVPFVVCFASALILVLVYNPAPSRPYRALFSWIHRLSGVALIAMPIVAAVRDRAEWRVHLHNVLQAWRWTLDDLKWLARVGFAAFDRRIELPEQGKFNAAEKLNFMMVMCTWPLFAVTGIAIWLPGVAFVSWLLHFAMALVAAPLMLGHIFMATVNPSTRIGLSGMVSGYVDRAWARHHYARWYRETARHPDGLRVRCPRCTRIQLVDSWPALLDHILEDAPLLCGACGVDMARVAVYTDSDEIDVGGLVRCLDRRQQGDGPDHRLPPAA